MATYAQIQDYVRDTHGFAPETCWIAHARELCGLPTRKAWNRIDPVRRKEPCPSDKLEAIKDAFSHFGMI